MVIQKSTAKEIASPFRVSAEFYPALEAEVTQLIQRAKKRAEANGRSTLQPHDL